jgi:hypothetical protein
MKRPYLPSDDKLSPFILHLELKQHGRIMEKPRRNSSASASTLNEDSASRPKSV